MFEQHTPASVKLSLFLLIKRSKQLRIYASVYDNGGDAQSFPPGSINYAAVSLRGDQHQ